MREWNRVGMNDMTAVSVVTGARECNPSRPRCACPSSGMTFASMSQVVARGTTVQHHGGQQPIEGSPRATRAAAGSVATLASAGPSRSLSYACRGTERICEARTRPVERRPSPTVRAGRGAPRRRLRSRSHLRFTAPVVVVLAAEPAWHNAPPAQRFGAVPRVGARGAPTRRSPAPCWAALPGR
jgi:hypothetical protein